MKNLYGAVLIFFLSLLSFGCAKSAANNLHIFKETSSVYKESPEASFENSSPACDCAKCPNIDPYLEGHNEFRGSNSQMLYWIKSPKPVISTPYDKPNN